MRRNASNKSTLVALDEHATPNAWLTRHELERKLGYDLAGRRSVRDMMRDGTFRRDFHWFEREGSRPPFWWPAIVAWLQGAD